MAISVFFVFRTRFRRARFAWLPDQEFEKLLKDLREGDSYEKHNAAAGLGKSGNPAALEPLILALNDNDYLVRSFAASSLGHLNDARAVDPLIKMLKDENQRVRRSAAEALGILRNPKALDALVTLQADDSVLVRRSAAMALGSLGIPEAIDPLIRGLRDPDSYVSDGAFIALVNMGSIGIPKLVQALADWSLGPKVAAVLKDLGWRPSTGEEGIRFYVATRDKQALLKNWETARKVLVSDANGGSSLQVQNAVLALIGIGQEEALDDLAGILRSRNSPEIARAFLDCGNSRLSDVARAWVREHGAEIRSAGIDPAVTWGHLQPLQQP
jgi:HEAT repeat protein